MWRDGGNGALFRTSYAEASSEYAVRERGWVYDSGSDMTVYFDMVNGFPAFAGNWTFVPNIEKPCHLQAQGVDGNLLYFKGDTRNLADPETDRYMLLPPAGVSATTGAYAKPQDLGENDYTDRGTMWLWSGYLYVTPQVGHDVSGTTHGAQSGGNKLGSYHCWNRVYDIFTGRWATPDPVARPWSNLLDYVPRPTSMADPAGLDDGWPDPPDAELPHGTVARTYGPWERRIAWQVWEWTEYSKYSDTSYWMIDWCLCLKVTVTTYVRQQRSLRLSFVGRSRRWVEWKSDVTELTFRGYVWRSYDWNKTGMWGTEWEGEVTALNVWGPMHIYRKEQTEELIECCDVPEWATVKKGLPDDEAGTRPATGYAYGVSTTSSRMETSNFSGETSGGLLPGRDRWLPEEGDPSIADPDTGDSTLKSVETVPK